MLNPKQKLWIEEFKQKFPGAELVSRLRGYASDRELTFRWVTEIPLPLIIGCTEPGTVKVWHQVKVTLRSSGTLRSSPEIVQRVEAPCCDLWRRSEGNFQLAFPFQEVMGVAIPKIKIACCKQSSIIKKRMRRLQSAVQLEFPLFGAAARLLEIERESGNTEVVSAQELLSEMVAHYDLEFDRVVQLPRAILVLLKDKQATPDEVDRAISIYQVAGPTGVLTYLDGLEDLRRHFGVKQVSVKVGGKNEIRVRSQGN